MVKMAKKRCSKCGKLKEESEFYKYKRGKDGLEPQCKNCGKEYKKQNKERLREKRHVYYEDHKAETRACNKEYYYAHREEAKEYWQTYRETNRETVKAVLRAWYVDNKAKIAKQQREYDQTPDGKLNMNRKNHRRRMRSKQAEATLTADQWQKILEMQNKKCNLCGRRFTKKMPPTVDHIIPVSKNGELTFENVQALCRSCNSRKHSKLAPEFIQSWAVIGQQSFAFSSP